MTASYPLPHCPADRLDEPRIARALATAGGHLAIGRGGFTLYYDRGCRLHGYDVEPVKSACISAGLPVIDDREVPFDVVARLAISGPMVAVGEEPSAPPNHALAYAPLAIVAEGVPRGGSGGVQPLTGQAWPSRLRGRGGRGTS